MVREGEVIFCDIISSILESRFSNCYANSEWLLTVRTGRGFLKLSSLLMGENPTEIRQYGGTEGHGPRAWEQELCSVLCNCSRPQFFFSEWSVVKYMYQ